MNPENNTYAFRNMISFSFANPAESEDDSDDVAVISFNDEISMMLSNMTCNIILCLKNG
jgi:hypothetical protein